MGAAINLVHSLHGALVARLKVKKKTELEKQIVRFRSSSALKHIIHFNTMAFGNGVNFLILSAY
jgi:hypothetical protein